MAATSRITISDDDKTWKLDGCGYITPNRKTWTCQECNQESDPVAIKVNRYSTMICSKCGTINEADTIELHDSIHVFHNNLLPGVMVKDMNDQLDVLNEQAKQRNLKRGLKKSNKK
jgi:transcription elongation factor Elf1